MTRSALQAVGLALALALSSASAGAQTAPPVGDDVSLLLRAPHGPLSGEPEVVAALARARANPSPYLLALGDTLGTDLPTTPPAYVAYVLGRPTPAALSLVHILADGAPGAERTYAADLLADLHRPAADASDAAWAAYEGALDEAGRPPPRSEALVDLRRAAWATAQVSTTTLEYLAALGDDRLLPSIPRRYWRASYTDRGALRSYSLVLTGRFEPPPRRSPFESLTGAVSAPDGVAASFAGSAFAVSGAPAEGAPVHGIAVGTEADAAAVRAVLSGGQAARVTGLDPAVAAAGLPFDAAAWADALADRAAVVLGDRPGGPVGTEAAPVVAYAPAGARLAGGFRGVGVLVVDGPLEMRGDAEWRGAVVVRSAGAVVDLRGSARVLGGLVVLGPDAALALGGRAAVRYSPEALALALAAAADQP